MENEKFEICMMYYLSDSLDVNEQKKFENFLLDHPEYQEQFDGSSQLWNQIDSTEIPNPSEEMDRRFFDMLRSEVQKMETPNDSSENWFSRLLENLWKPQFAYGLLFLGIGLGVGYFLNSGNLPKSMNTTIVNNQETERVRERLVLTLLEQPSATKRLQAIGEANKIENIDEKIIHALLKTLNNDTNVNVRLAAIESLTNYLNDPLVREGLVQSIVKQDSPIVQVTLANLMVALQEKKSIEPFKTLMRTKKLNESVKHKLETSIESII
jgi:hypothetical protein